MEYHIFTKAIEHIKSTKGLNENLLKHIAPLGWEHINFLGEYIFEMKSFSDISELRPLKIEN